MKNRLGPSGRISGFSRIEVGDEKTEASVPGSNIVSVNDLILRFNQVVKDLDPDLLADIEQKINAHINSSTNVHGLSNKIIADQVLIAFINDIFPGTPPNISPDFSLYFEPEQAYTGVTRTNPTDSMFITDLSGVLKAAPATGVPVDYGVDGSPMVPVFPERTNHWIRSQTNHASITSGAANTQRITTFGTTLDNTNTGTTAIMSPADITAPTNEVLAILGSVGDTEHGIFLERVDTYTAGDDVTVSMFLYKGTSKYISFELEDDDGLTVYVGRTVVDMGNKTIENKISAITPHLHRHPSGWVRVGLTFNHRGSAGDAFFLKIYAHDEGGITSYDIATAGDRLFYIYGINATKGPGLAPYIPTAGAAVTIAETDIIFGMTNYINSGKGTIAVTWVGSGNGLVTAGDAFGDNLLSLNTDMELFNVTDNGVKTLVGSAEILSVAVLLHGEYNTHVISWDSDSVIGRSDNNSIKINDNQMTFSGTYTAVKMGPAPGYIKSLLHYSARVSSDVIDYLIGETDPTGG